MIQVNLLPGAAQRSKSRSSFRVGDAFAGFAERFTDKYLMMGVAGALLGLTAIGGMYTYQSREAASIDARESAASADSARYAAVLKARARAQTTRDSLYQQLAIIKSIDDSRFIWPHLLEEINRAVPQYTWLVSVTQTSPITSGAAASSDTSAAARAKADSIQKTMSKDARLAAGRARADSLFQGTASTVSFRIVGQTVDVQALTQFMKTLEASPFIKNVQLTRSDLVTSDAKEVTEFQLEARSEVPPRTLLRTVPLSVEVR